MPTRITMSQLQDNAGKFIHECHREPVEITRHGKTMAYIVPVAMMNIQHSYSLNATSSSESSFPSISTIADIPDAVVDLPKENHEEIHSHE